MLEIGKTFLKNGKTFCLIKLLNYKGENYAIFSVEDNEISFVIYKIIETFNDYQLKIVVDDSIKFALYEMIEREAD